jgi:putative DNA primase/helicase
MTGAAFVDEFERLWQGQNAAPSAGLTEDELALEFTRRHQNELRYVAAWSTWMRWTGTIWRKENTLEAYDRARAVCRAAGSGLTDAKLRARILSSATRSAVENMARSDRAHAATADQWDRDQLAITAPEEAVWPPLTCAPAAGAHPTRSTTSRSRSP